MKSYTIREIITKCVKGQIDIDTEWILKPKKYHLKLDIDLPFGLLAYLNYSKQSKEFLICSRYESMELKTKFTVEEIEDMEIPMRFFRMEEC